MKAKMYRLIAKHPNATAWSIALESKSKRKINKVANKFVSRGWQTEIERI